MAAYSAAQPCKEAARPPPRQPTRPIVGARLAVAHWVCRRPQFQHQLLGRLWALTELGMMELERSVDPALDFLFCDNWSRPVKLGTNIYFPVTCLPCTKSHAPCRTDALNARADDFFLAFSFFLLDGEGDAYQGGENASIRYGRQVARLPERLVMGPQCLPEMAGPEIFSLLCLLSSKNGRR
jgi:hypothetical protein